MLVCVVVCVCMLACVCSECLLQTYANGHADLGDYLESKGADASVLSTYGDSLDVIKSKLQCLENDMRGLAVEFDKKPPPSRMTDEEKALADRCVGSCSIRTLERQTEI